MNALLQKRLSDAARAMLGSLLRHALTIIGTSLVTRGLIDQGTVDGIIPMAVEMLVGIILAAGATGWAQLRAYGAHTRWAIALEALRSKPAETAPSKHPPLN